VEAFAMLSSNSGGGLDPCCDLGMESVVLVAVGAVVETRNSRHCGVVEVLDGREDGVSEGVMSVDGNGAVDWKA
jgi:hypothetical protein